MIIFSTNILQKAMRFLPPSPPEMGKIMSNAGYVIVCSFSIKRGPANDNCGGRKEEI
jgi:hypothetical protein